MIESKKVGIVIFVGKAARLVTRTIAIAAIAKEKNRMLFPEYMTTKSVSGVIKHAWDANAIPNQRNLLSCWFLHQVIKRARMEGFCIVWV
jgi:hypothetical protein